MSGDVPNPTNGRAGGSPSQRSCPVSPDAQVQHSPLDVVVLGGGGHVGLPLSLVLARAGMRVGIFDTDESTVARISAGEMPFMETGADDLLRDLLPTGRLEVSAEPAIVARAEIVVIVIGTPVDEFLAPSMSVFQRAVDQIGPYLRDGMLVVLRSTVYPGTTAFVEQAVADRGLALDIAYCPERIAEGHALEELSSLPQIVGADDARSGERAAALFGRLGTKPVRVTSREAELAKLFTNTCRYMAFKAESDDVRASLSYKLRKLLTWAGAQVLCTDPYVPDDRLVPIERVVAESEILILGAPHRAYRSLQLGGRDVVDVWNAMGTGIRL